MRFRGSKCPLSLSVALAELGCSRLFAPSTRRTARRPSKRSPRLTALDRLSNGNPPRTLPCANESLRPTA